MPLSIHFDKAFYDDERQAVVAPAFEGNTQVTCLVTGTALNDRANTYVEGEALVIVFWSLQEEIGLLLQEMYALGSFTAENEIWLTSRELYR